MDRIFLATMVSAVLLLIVAADLLVNGLGLQQDPVNLASRDAAIRPAGQIDVMARAAAKRPI